MICALLASLLWCSSGVAEAASPPLPEFDAVVRALERSSLRFRVVGEDKDVILVGYQTERYRDLDGDLSVQLQVKVEEMEQRPWLVVYAFNVYSLYDCAHPAAARRVLMGIGFKIRCGISFIYDESDGTVNGRIALPIPAEGIDSELLESLLSQFPAGLDAVDPVLRRAMGSGMVDWPSDDLGPKQPTDFIEGHDSEGNTVRIGWAIWAEKRAFVSTLVSADPMLREFCAMDDEQRDEFGRGLAKEFGSSISRSVFVNWLEGAKYIEQHYPPVAVRFFGPEGTEVSATVRCPEVARAASVDRRIIDSMGHIDVEPVLRWNDDALLEIDHPKQVTFSLELVAAGGKAGSEAVVEFVPVGIAELDLPAIIPAAMYVNESHPWVRDIIAEAGRSHLARSLGYQEATDYAEALTQIFAVWQAFRARDLKYASINASDGLQGATQAIRQFHESIADESANCVDGTAAMASVLAALGFDVHLFQVPNHVLLGVQVRNPGIDREWIFIETTGLGTDAVIASQSYFDEIEDRIPDEHRDAEWNCFEAACHSADDSVDAARKGETLLVASLRTLRGHGLKPIPVSKSIVGAIPSCPAPGPIAARRAAAQERIDRQHAQLQAWIESLPHKSPVPYADARQAARDIERIGVDPTAIGRLLRSFAGNGVSARCLRALSVVTDSLAPLDQAALEYFGTPSPSAGALLSLPASGATVTIERADAERQWIKVRLGHDDPVMTLCLLKSNGVFFLDTDWLDYGFDAVGRDALTLARSLRDHALEDAVGLARVGQELADRVRAGEFEDRTKLSAEVMRTIQSQFGRAGQAEAAGTPSPLASPGPAPQSREVGIRDEVIGGGPPAAEGDLVTLHYTCSLADGKSVFDSRAGGGDARKRTAGAGSKPRGFGRALVGMRVGGRRVVVVGPEDGFGAEGLPKLGIPPNATLVYEIEAIAVTSR